jgi:hypothetical protein
MQPALGDFSKARGGAGENYGGIARDAAAALQLSKNAHKLFPTIYNYGTMLVRSRSQDSKRKLNRLYVAESAK